MINIIAAISKNHVIGINDKIPWDKPDDLKYFKKNTLGEGKNAVIMGYNTWSSIGKILRGRLNVIIDKNAPLIDSIPSCSPAFQNETVKINSLGRAIKLCKENPSIQDIWIIGGQQIYFESYKRDDIDNLYITKINAFYEGNKIFPNDLNNFVLTSNIRSSTDADVEFLIYKRKTEEYQYMSLIKTVLDNGTSKNDRTCTGIISYFGNSMRFNLQKGFPLLTTKKMFLRGVIEELLWILRGQTDASILKDKKVHIWDHNTSRSYLDNIGLACNKEGDAGPIYGFNLRHFGAEYKDCKEDYSNKGTDQLEYIIFMLKNSPNSRRILFSMWDPTNIEKSCLPPCHVLYQFWVSGNKLSCSMYQRSGDIGLGVPFNIASASLMTHIIAKLTDLVPSELFYTIGDAHIYLDHVKELKEQITREPFKFPTITIKDRNQQSPNDFRYEDFELNDYISHPGIKMKMS